MPHTITTWVGSALCVSKEQGFGMSDPSSIEAFQPFFLEVHLPYSVKRDEKLQIKVSVFNYLSYDIPIKLTLEKSKSFKLFVGSNSVKFCLPSRNSVVQQFGMYALELGSRNVTVTAVIDDSFVGACGPETLPSGRDTVKKELIVKPEGFPIERVYSRMVCPKEFDDDRTLVVDLTLPHDLVEGSQRAWVTAVGDMMGPTLEGLSSLVRLPVGCGEQNMVLFTPNIFVMQYLESTNQLTKKIEEKTVGFMTKGYQRQLNYRHSDGSYSAFGPRDQSGSLWLTAFVVKSFAAARRYVHIDSNNLQKSVEWLQSKQLKNGCFPVVGTVLSSDMKGGAGGSDKDLAPLTAYTLVSLMEMYSSNSKMVPKKLLANTLPCLRVDDSENRDLYTTALSSYALALAGEMVQTRQLVDWLLSKATRGSDGRTLWWEKPGSGKALNVELTSYALLSLVKLKAPRDVLEAGSIVRWLSKQRNSWGGFVSTQDTVVALQAMGEYASLVGLQLVDIKMNVFAETFARNFSIREKDRLVQRRVDLPLPLASDVTINSSTGRSGCATIQTTLRYNVHTAPESDAFDLTLTTAPLNQGACGAHNLTICPKYLLSESSNMALIEIAMISGYQVDKSSLDSLISNKSGVKRYEVKDDNVVLYFDEIQSRSQVCFDVVVQLAFQVADAKDSNIQIYDYYHTEHAKSLSYNLPSRPC